MIELVRQDFGPEAANSAARRMVMPAHRSGGQTQFLEPPVAVRPKAEIAPLLDQMRPALRRRWKPMAYDRNGDEKLAHRGLSSHISTSPTAKTHSSGR